MTKIATLGRAQAGRLAMALLMLTLLPACSWLGRGDPTPPPLPPTVGGVSPRVAWSASIGNGGVGFQPVVVGEAVFAAAADGTVVRFEAGSGKVVWRVSVGQTLSAGVGASEAIAVVASRDGEVIALNAADGRQLWKVAAGTEVLSSPSVGLNTVLVRVGEKILALEAADGKTRWSWQRALPTLVLRQPSPVAIASMPTADGLVSLAFAGLPGGDWSHSISNRVRCAGRLPLHSRAEPMRSNGFPMCSVAPGSMGAKSAHPPIRAGLPATMLSAGPRFGHATYRPGRGSQLTHGLPLSPTIEAISSPCGARPANRSGVRRPFQCVGCRNLCPAAVRC